jgi:hypothetical protein
LGIFISSSMNSNTINRFVLSDSYYILSFYI